LAESYTSLGYLYLSADTGKNAHLSARAVKPF